MHIAIYYENSKMVRIGTFINLTEVLVTHEYTHTHTYTYTRSGLHIQVYIVPIKYFCSCVRRDVYCMTVCKAVCVLLWYCFSLSHTAGAHFSLSWARVSRWNSECGISYIYEKESVSKKRVAKSVKSKWHFSLYLYTYIKYMYLSLTQHTQAEPIQCAPFSIQVDVHW